MNHPKLDSPAAVQAFERRLADPAPVLALAPMQAITDLPFWTLLASYGGPDLYWTEFFRITQTWRPEKWILQSLDLNPTGRPAMAQLIGNDPDAMTRAIHTLSAHGIASIDLNLGCPAPVVYKKCAGGGLLRDLPRTDRLLGVLRRATAEVGLKFTVKTRIGFDSQDNFPELLDILASHNLDLVSVHGRTVAEMYRSEVHYDAIRMAVERLPCPVLANGNVDSPERARWILNETGARGLMIGRGCVRNPWIFQQIRQFIAEGRNETPKGRQVLDYIERLWISTEPPDSKDRLQVEQMKRHLNFIGQGVGRTSEESERFLHQIRRSTDRVGFFAICREFLDHEDPAPLIPHT